MPYMWNQIDLLTKRLLGGGLEKVKTMDTFPRYDDPGFDYDEKANFLSSQGCYQTYNSDNQGRNYGCDSYQGSWQNRDSYKRQLQEWLNGSVCANHELRMPKQ